MPRTGSFRSANCWKLGNVWGSITYALPEASGDKSLSKALCWVA